ncbi:hypothetical protein WJX73_000500 [Symbiochloris irregularis]|uniref:Sugar phosphate transporter domain-containing protein n=1 Tax=Symbiochloris irregularis TaxID=706552 RepID=A0AAW1NIJ5_9CHLO
MGSLWLGNAAYLYLSVSFIQMLKALSPVAVFTLGCVMGKERYSHAMISIMCAISLGVAVASFGEIKFVPSGVIYQLSSIVTESIRVLMVQIILQEGNAFSALFMGAQVTALNVEGYAIAFAGVTCYNYMKLHSTEHQQEQDLNDNLSVSLKSESNASRPLLKEPENFLDEDAGNIDSV